MSNHKSFTLIELLVVIAIIGVLAAIIITSISGAVTKSRIARLQIFSDSIRAQLSDSLVSWWPFNEGTGTLAYDKWEGNNGTLGGGTPDYYPTWKSGGECVLGKCLEFDGINDYVDCGSNSSLDIGLNDLTISFWAKLNNDVNNNFVANGGGGNSWPGWNVWYYSVYQDLRFYFSDGTTRITGNSNDGLNIADGNWHFLTISVIRSANATYYVNGISKGITNISAYINDDIGHTTNLTIGSWAGGITGGLIDEVRIYNSAAIITQIQSQYLAGLDKLLSNGAISKSEYNQRTKELSKSLVIE